MKAGFSMRAVAQQTGLSPHVIRAWERRYGAIAPQRAGNRRRNFSEEDVQRLVLLRRATLAGHSIGTVAKLSTRELHALLRNTERLQAAGAVDSQDAGAPFRAAGLRAVQRMDAAALEQGLQHALVTLGHQGLLRNVIAPMAQQVGELWRDGTMTAAHEHFFTASAKLFLGHVVGKQFAPPGHAPLLVACTPINQHHELGALIASVAATHLGWRVVYLGPALPAAEIAGAALQNQARAVALSLVHPEDDPLLPDELRALRRFLPVETGIIAGGRAIPGYAKTLKEIGALIIADIDGLFRRLDALRWRRGDSKKANPCDHGNPPWPTP